MKTCKDCEHSSPSTNSKWPDAIYCNKAGGHYDDGPCHFKVSCFTPKKPKEPEKPAEKSCDNCRLCSDANLGMPKGYIYCEHFKTHNRLKNNHAACFYWQPIPKPAEKSDDKKGKMRIYVSNPRSVGRTATEIAMLQAEWERITASYRSPLSMMEYCTGLYPPVNSKPDKLKSSKKVKENKMFKKLKHIYRMVASLWHYYGIFILCCVLNPWLFRLAGLVKPAWKDAILWSDGEVAAPAVLWDSSCWYQILLVWAIAIAAIAAFIGVTYTHHRYVQWYFGEKK